MLVIDEILVIPAAIRAAAKANAPMAVAGLSI